MALSASDLRGVRKAHRWFAFLEIAVFRQYSATVKVDLGLTSSCKSKCFHSKGN